jgi:hypothetical protein
VYSQRKQQARGATVALVTKLEEKKGGLHGAHLLVECTYEVVEIDGQRLLQLDTYGSTSRKLRGKKSQTIRFAPEALAQLKELLLRYQL